MIHVIYNDQYSFSILIVVKKNKLRPIHIIQDRWLYWEKPIIYNMIWKYETVGIVRIIINKLMNRMGKTKPEKIGI